MEQLRIDRHLILADLKLAELKLLVMFQEFKMLRTYEVKDVALQHKQRKCVGDKDEITGHMSEYKLKLNMKLDDLQMWNDKITAVSTELNIVLPERYEQINFPTFLLRIFFIISSEIFLFLLALCITRSEYFSYINFIFFLPINRHLLIS